MASSGRKKRSLTEEETSVLLDLWADDRIQAKFNNYFRHNLIWEDIALRMRGMGYNRSGKECYNRVGNLKKIFARKKRDFETGVADATDWTYWSHLETLFKSIPSSSQAVNEDEDFSDQFLKVEESVCDDDYAEEENQGEGYKEEELMMNGNTASAMSDSLAVLMGDLDGEDDDEEFSTQQSQMITVQPSPSPSPRIKKKPAIKKSKRRAHSDDYYIKQLIENDKQMLRNQQRQLQLDEQVSTAALQFFSVMTAYLNKVNSTMQPPTSKDSTVPSPPGLSKLPSDTEPSPQAQTTQKSDSVAPQTVRQVKRLCTTDISQNPMCNGVSYLKKR
ncbi:hypothetical protein B7P43_G16902 [Cryptotermes secundus]|uniref:Myb/SANT-like DNA-binding domain-containing protein n=1 Tax=Cryptotermes secundus TaxID=105785 RepID=A0A2J7QFS2_9NEOP|nr:uncharacterized protein LOC111867826 [Cryptotermes secundus]PNF27434.1 hypothetical protein B7P43_G16902 [Cryptotermes secundus]